jgi:TP901 family phage tail tape measure protein
MADNELTLHINAVFDGAEKLSKQIADSIPKSGMNKKRASATSQKLAGTDAQLSQLESIWQQMDPQEALASLRKILVSYEKINFGMAKYSAEAQKEIQDLTDQIESKQEELDNLSRKDKINRGKLGSVRYNRDENDNIVGAKSLTLGSTEIKAGLPDVLKGTDLDVDKGARAALLNAQKDDSLTDEQKKAAEAYAEEVQAKEAILLEQLNKEIQLREKLKKEIAELEAQKSKKIENATTPSDTFSEDNAINTGTTEQLIKNTNDAADAVKKAAGEEKDLGEETAKTEKKQKKQDNTVTKAIKSFFGYQQVIRALRTVVNFTVKTITDLDKALTDQAIVSGLTRSQVYGLVNSYESLAKQTGFTTTEIAGTASKFLQQGKTVADTLKLTKAAAESARVAGISASQAVDYLTTALNGFQMTADQSLEVSDKFAALAAASATSYEELATALSKVAAQANLAGMSMDYTLALLAKGVETTRESAESIGTALKTVIARMREITDYGATLEDGTDVNNVETQLKAVGISLRDNAGELRSTQDVLNDLGLKWDSLSKNQQAALAKALAGTRQQSRLISMMNDYGRTLELLEISQNSLGATEAQQTKYMQSMAAATNNVQVA